jgi:RNAse (barnase) inhibitor barstar
MSDNSHLQTVLANASTAGVYHLPHIDKSQVVAAAKAGGLAIFRIDLAKAANKEQMLAIIAKSLNFPDWFGHNFDALADCLADMGWHPAEGYVVLLEHCDSIHGKAEEDFVSALNIFEQAASDWREEGVPFWCLVEMQADGIAWLPTGP